MKGILKNAMLACLGTVLAAVCSVSCEDLKSGDSYLGTVTVTLAAPAGLDDFDFTVVTVKATNTADGVVKEVNADKNGVAFIEGLTAGSYNISAAGNFGQIAVVGVVNGVLVVSKENTDAKIDLLVGGSASGLVIKEVFYSGHSMEYDAGMVTMMKDSFVEIFNNSDETQYLDGLYIANLWSYSKSESGLDAPEYSMSNDPSLDKNYVYADIVVRIPGSGKDYPLAPGKSFLFASNAINFNKELRDAMTDPDSWFADMITEEGLAHIIDLSVADMESYAVTWMQGQGRDGNDWFDLDNPDVPNAENIYYESSMDYFFLDMNGASVVIARPDKTLTSDDIYTYKYAVGGENKEKILMKIPVSSVLDGVDTVRDLESAKWKCLTNTVDLGFSFIPDDFGGMTNCSIRRKADSARSAEAGRLVLADTNNSSEDFEAVEPPTPKGGYDGYTL